MKNKLFNKWDIILVLLVLACCMAVFALRGLVGSDTVAQIYEAGEITSQINLTQVSESYTIMIHGATVLIENGRIRYKEADCPDNLCVNSGWLSKPGEVAACVPNRTVICIRGLSRRNSMHAVTY